MNEDGRWIGGVKTQVNRSVESKVRKDTQGYPEKSDIAIVAVYVETLRWSQRVSKSLYIILAYIYIMYA